MTLADALEIGLRFRHALVLGLGVSFVAAISLLPYAMRKLKGAGIVGIDIHKAHRPEVPEMGGIAVFVAFNVGAFFVLGFGILPPKDEALILACLIVAAGACTTGIVDDLVELRQRFKALLPVAFAGPLALYAPSSSIDFPQLGEVHFGLLYPLILVPAAIACTSNGFNMLEGFNGLGAGLGIVMALSMGIMAIIGDNIAGLALLLPLIGALGGFLWFNVYPARVFPGDTMTLFVGAVLACAAILSKIEFWGALLFLPHVAEFMIKGFNHFPSRGWGGELWDGRLHCPPRRPVGLAQWILKMTGGLREGQLVTVMVATHFLWSMGVAGWFYLAHT